jgi:hypothetical protein
MLVQRTCSHEEAVASESTLTTAIPTVSASATLKDFAQVGRSSAAGGARWKCRRSFRLRCCD